VPGGAPRGSQPHALSVFVTAFAARLAGSQPKIGRTREVSRGTRVAPYAPMLIENILRPKTLLLALCLGAAAGACSVDTDDDDDAADDDDGDDVDVDVDACHEDCNEGKITCEGDCDDEDDACIGSCSADFDDCDADC
jgi:hypothetical protein